MRTNIVIKDVLLKRAFSFAPVKTKKDLVELALSEFVENHARKNLQDLQGRIRFREGYDYKALRRGA